MFVRSARAVFGFFPKFSTPVENTVENVTFQPGWGLNLMVFTDSRGAKTSIAPDRGTNRATAGFGEQERLAHHEAKVMIFRLILWA